MTLTFGSLFAGIGGMDLGLERAGMSCRWQVEINPYCQRILAKHWPNVTRHADVREVGSHNLERVDLICGGFPCQDISNAGKRAGIDGERSGLWSEYARIVRDLRPRFVLVENVAALLARGLGRVLGDLASCGYDAEWDCLPAAAVGAPHRRDRLFIVAHAQHRREPQRTWTAWRQGGQRASVGSGPRGDGAELADAERSRLEGLEQGGTAAGATLGSDSVCAGLWPPGPNDLDAWRGVLASRPDLEPSIRRVAHGLPNRVDRLRGLGNAVVPDKAEFIGRRILEVA